MRSPVSTILVALAMALLVGLSSGPAAAQNEGMGGFFRFLFGGGQPQQQPQQQPAPQPQQPRVSRPKPPPEPKIVEAPKDANAQVVMVIGDSQANGLAQGLQIAFADTPGVAIVNKSKPNSSIVRDDEFDWIAQLPATLAEGRVDFIVIMLGVNDRQPYYDKKGTKIEDLKTDRWEQLYKERVAKIAEIAKATGKPVFWVGMPPMERPTFSAFMGFLNGIVKPTVEAAGVTFVDIWPGFTDDEGKFTYSGPDVDGQNKRLRAGDGVHFNRTGQRKLAYFVEQSIRDLIKGLPVASPEPTTPEAPSAPQATQEAILAAPPPLPPAPWKKVGPVINITEPPADGETDLAGAPATAARPGQTPLPAAKIQADSLPGGYPITETPLYRRLVRGESIEAPKGRVDDYRLPATAQ